MLLIDGNESWQIISVLLLSCSLVILFHSHSYVLSALLTMLLQTRLTRSIMYIVISVCRCFTLYALFRFPTRNCKPERREREREKRELWRVLPSLPVLTVVFLLSQFNNNSTTQAQSQASLTHSLTRSLKCALDSFNMLALYN